MNGFAVAAAAWLGATEVRVVDARAPVAAHDAVARSAVAWQSTGADPDAASAVVGDDRLEFATLPDSGSPNPPVLVVRRALRRPRPAAHADRLAAVVALAGRLVESGADGRDDLLRPARDRLLDTAADGGALIVVSVDRLAVVNEALGRDAGTAVLDALAERLQAWAGREGVLARLSGTRFGIARPDFPDLDAALTAAGALREQLAEPVSVAGRQISRSVSVGVAFGPAGNALNLVRQAMMSTLAARESGGDAVRAYDAAAADERLKRLELELDLGSALRLDQLRVHYQPEFDLRTGHLLAVEALLRWQHPRLGLVRADAFVDDNEQSRTFAGVQRWVIEEAIGQLARWTAHPAGRALGLRINISAWHLARGDVAEDLLATIERHRVVPENVCVELTERRIPRSPERIASALLLLNSRGVSLAIDDFGTGQGTLSQLFTLPVDTIKIDQSFVAAMRTDPRAEAAVAGVIALADSLSLETVAEGVDGADTAARLVQLGCTRGQGNSLGEAMPAVQVDALLNRRRPA